MEARYICCGYAFMAASGIFVFRSWTEVRSAAEMVVLRAYVGGLKLNAVRV